MAGLARVVALVVVASSCAPGGGPGPGPASPGPTTSPVPRMARFEARFNLIRAVGVSCSGVEGPFRVRLHPPNPIEGKGAARLRLPDGAGRLRWSFTASHPGQGTVTYAGNLRARLVGRVDRPSLVFTGTQTNVGATGRTFTRVPLELSESCPG